MMARLAGEPAPLAVAPLEAKPPPRVIRARHSQPRPAPSRSSSGRPLPCPGRCRLGQDARYHPQDCTSVAGRIRTGADRGHHLHEQGLRGNARAGQGTGRPACREAPRHQHLPFARRAPAAHRRVAAGPQGAVLDPRQRRRALDPARCRQHHRRCNGAPLAMDHQPLEEPGFQQRAGRGRGAGR